MKTLDDTYEDTWIRRSEKLKESGMSYIEYLNSEHWFSVKEKASKRSNYKCCEICGCSKVELHHTSYKWIMTKDELRTIIAVRQQTRQVDRHGNR